MADINIKAKIEVENIGTLKQQLKEAQNDVQALADKFGATSVQAIEAAKRAADLKDRIGDAKSLVDAFNPDAKFKSLTAALSGAAGGFAAVQGAIGLVGVESKEVEATLLKVNSAMALSEGLQNVGESVDSFKQLGAVIQQSTVFIKLNDLANKAAAGAMKLFGFAVESTSVSFKVLKTAIAATGIGLLIVALGELYSAFQSYQSAATKAKEAQDALNKSIISGAKIALNAEMESLKQQEQLELARARQKGATEKEIFDIENSYRRLRIASQKRFLTEVSDKDIDAANETLKQITNTNNEITIKQIDFDISEKKREEEKQKELARIRKEQREKAAKEEQERVEKANKLLDDSEKRRQELNKEFDKNAKDKKDKEAKEEEEQRKADDAYLEAEYQKEVDLGNKKIDQANKVAAVDKANAEQKKAEQEAQKDLAMGTLDTLSGLVDKNSVAGKSIAVATAVMNTYEGASKAIAQGGVFGPIAAAATIAAGLLNVKKIISTKIPSAKGGGNVGDGATPSLTASAPISPIQMGTQLNQASIQGIGNAAAGGVNRAFILEADINNSNERQVRLQRAARLG
jgi:chromosome segregation ATPase